MCVPSLPFHLHITSLGPLPNCLALLVGRLEIVVRMVTQQGISFGHVSQSCVLREKWVLEPSLQHTANSRGMSLSKDCNLSPISLF